MNTETNTQNKNGSIVAILIVAILILVASVFAYNYYNKIKTLGQNPEKANQEKVAEVVSKVSKIIDLPKGENPVLAVISDTAPLVNNPFFAKAKIGDQVLLYPISKKAFLFDPKANIIVEVASLNIGNK